MCRIASICFCYILGPLKSLSFIANAVCIYDKLYVFLRLISNLDKNSNKLDTKFTLSRSINKIINNSKQNSRTYNFDCSISLFYGRRSSTYSSHDVSRSLYVNISQTYFKCSTLELSLVKLKYSANSVSATSLLKRVAQI